MTFLKTYWDQVLVYIPTILWTTNIPVINYGRFCGIVDPMNPMILWSLRKWKLHFPPKFPSARTRFSVSLSQTVFLKEEIHKSLRERTVLANTETLISSTSENSRHFLNMCRKTRRLQQFGPTLSWIVLRVHKELIRESIVVDSSSEIQVGHRQVRYSSLARNRLIELNLTNTHWKKNDKLFWISCLRNQEEKVSLTICIFQSIFEINKETEILNNSTILNILLQIQSWNRWSLHFKKYKYFCTQNIYYNNISENNAKRQQQVLIS